MNLVQLLINGISYSQTQNGAYALILSEIEGERKLPIVIGTNEAQSIAIAIEKEIKPPRPLTHDLFKNFFANSWIPLVFCLLKPQLFNWEKVKLDTTFGVILLLHFFLNFKKTLFAAATLIC